MNEIRHGNAGWTLEEFSVNRVHGANMERFEYSRKQGEETERAVGYRQEGNPVIEFAGALA